MLVSIGVLQGFKNKIKEKITGFTSHIHIIPFSVNPDLRDDVFYLTEEEISDLYKKEENVLPEEIQNLVNERNEARANKNWAESDRIRDLLIEKGYTVKDSKEGTIVEK